MRVTDKMLRASQVAAVAHTGQLYNNKPYIEHPARVYHRIWDMGYEDEDIYCVAWLHDVVEDTSVTLEEIRAEFGDRVADAVDAISRRKVTRPLPDKVRGDKVWKREVVGKESEEEYLARVAANEIASIVKHADMIDNLMMTRAVGCVPDKQRLWIKYIKAISFLWHEIELADYADYLADDNTKKQE